MIKSRFFTAADKEDQYRFMNLSLSLSNYSLLMEADQEAASGRYECATCGKKFASFQALGGHRTSHNKIIRPMRISRVSGGTARSLKPTSSVISKIQKKSSSTIKLASGRPGTTTRSWRGRHECSICGEEFLLGQALGGHMRRHKPIIRNKKIKNLKAAAADQHAAAHVVMIRDFDLNLLPPIDHPVISTDWTTTTRDASTTISLTASSTDDIDHDQEAAGGNILKLDWLMF